ncbi:MAG: T9SS type A sorting domain-containing protein, partial [Prolixibacteraceae bacterium]
PVYAREHLRSFFELGPEYRLTADVSDLDHGHIIVNTIPIQKETTGVAENPYPWQGIYFEKMPLRLEAVPAEGFEFVRWESNTGVLEERIVELNPESEQQFTAIFMKSAKTDELVHYWNFNDTQNLLSPTYSLLTAKLLPGLPAGEEPEVTFATGKGFAAENARFADETGTHLRVNYPLQVSLTFDVPTTGFSKIKFSYETRRSGQGAGKQIIEYSTDGTNFIYFSELIVQDDDPDLIVLNFSEIEAVNNNPAFKIRIRFEQGEGGTAGNNRFDNVTLEGIPDDDVNLPPEVIAFPENLFAVEGDENITLNLNEIFQDPEEDPLSFTISGTFSQVVETKLSGSTATLIIKNRGESLITLTAADETNTSFKVSFRILVYPRAFNPAKSDFTFTEWDANAPVMTFPEHILFLQSNIDDPTDTDPLEFAYYIPENEYSGNDDGNIGFPYRNTSRTRLNGLGENGISFINTGRGRDLGGLLLALNTMEAEEIQAEWLSETILRNSREYGLKLQYRIGHTGQFTDIEGTEYIAGNDGHGSKTGPLYLPEQLLNQEYVQLLWRHHYLSGDSGPRAHLRLDDILVKAETSPINATDLAENNNSLEVYPNPFSENFRVKLKLNRIEETEIWLYDLSGRKILTVFKGKAMNGESTYEMNGSHLTPGTYILICRTESEIFRQKVVKQ